ncbi:hypothetical protein BDV24DRAFT_160328 [Aspergillus arachidicola]|uniref:Uncharacterized protein n=1 Tax=Aspergillus arachidicola TaxID=656916 RepID=A0A5N6YH59_9EURO|nr:hypothetical protein BDV24DRAFT_160328 [Aspergillus arachidicola]
MANISRSPENAENFGPDCLCERWRTTVHPLLELSMFAAAAAVNHNLHRQHRGYLNPYFSKHVIAGLKSTVHAHITKMLTRFEEHLN